jgi:hypothetical protein
MRFSDGSEIGTAWNIVQALKKCDVGPGNYYTSIGEENMSSQWKSLSSARPKKAKQVKSKVKSMLIILFDIKGIVYKRFFLTGQTVDSAYYCDLFTAT